VKVHPRAKRSAITERLGDPYKLDLAASPNLAGVPRAAVRIVKGASIRTRVLEVDGLDDAELERRLLTADK
jgi:hypothetical protein